MSEALTVLSDVLDRLTPIDVVMARGLSAKAIERLHDDLEDAIEEDEYAESAAAAAGAVASAEAESAP